MQPRILAHARVLYQRYEPRKSALLHHVGKSRVILVGAAVKEQEGCDQVQGGVVVLLPASQPVDCLAAIAVGAPGGGSILIAGVHSLCGHRTDLPAGGDMCI